MHVCINYKIRPCNVLLQCNNLPCYSILYCPVYIIMLLCFSLQAGAPKHRTFFALHLHSNKRYALCRV